MVEKGNPLAFLSHLCLTFIQQHKHSSPTGLHYGYIMYGALVSAVLWFEVQQAYSFISSPAFLNELHGSLQNTDSICCIHLFFRDKAALFVTHTASAWYHHSQDLLLSDALFMLSLFLMFKPASEESTSTFQTSLQIQWDNKVCVC